MATENHWKPLTTSQHIETNKKYREINKAYQTQGWWDENWKAKDTFKHIKNNKKYYAQVRLFSPRDARERIGNHQKPSITLKIKRGY